MVFAEFLREVNGIEFIDIGSSGSLDIKWNGLEKNLHLTGFDPNEAECKRMASLPNGFLSLEYLPYAIAGENGIQTLYKTKSIYCYSLLKPNTKWLERFSFSDLFEITGYEEMKTVKLVDVEQLQNRDIDIIKVDTQGLEMPILSNAGEILEKSFLVETETGLVKNYIGETTFAEIDLFMRANGFLLFDLNTDHRISRNNQFQNYSENRPQILWCEATWLKDYIGLIQSGKITSSVLTRVKAIKSLIICAQQKFIDYGFELATLYSELHLIDKTEYKQLHQRENWFFPSKPNNKSEDRKPKTTVLNLLLRLLPLRMRTEFSRQVQLSTKQKHLFHF